VRDSTGEVASSRKRQGALCHIWWQRVNVNCGVDFGYRNAARGFEVVHREAGRLFRGRGAARCSASSSVHIAAASWGHRRARDISKSADEHRRAVGRPRMTDANSWLRRRRLAGNDRFVRSTARGQWTLRVVLLARASLRSARATRADRRGCCKLRDTKNQTMTLTSTMRLHVAPR
jgi:hypothetical protein